MWKRTFLWTTVHHLNATQIIYCRHPTVFRDRNQTYISSSPSPHHWYSLEKLRKKKCVKITLNATENDYGYFLFSFFMFVCKIMWIKYRWPMKSGKKLFNVTGRLIHKKAKHWWSTRGALWPKFFRRQARQDNFLFFI